MPCPTEEWEISFSNESHALKFGFKETQTLPCFYWSHPPLILGPTCIFKLQNLECQSPQDGYNSWQAGEIICSWFAKSIACDFLKENRNYILPPLARILSETLTQTPYNLLINFMYSQCPLLFRDYETELPYNRILEIFGWERRVGVGRSINNRVTEKSPLPKDLPGQDVKRAILAGLTCESPSKPCRWTGTCFWYHKMYSILAVLTPKEFFPL